MSEKIDKTVVVAVFLLMRWLHEAMMEHSTLIVLKLHMKKQMQE